MAYTLQVHGERRPYPIPNGLYELMSDITREVLRNQPFDLINYIADYIDALIETQKLAGVAVTAVDEILEGDDACVALCRSLGISIETANRAASIIQAAFLGYMARKKIEKTSGSAEAGREKDHEKTPISMDTFLNSHKISFSQANHAASIIQAAWRGYMVRKRLRREKEMQTTISEPYVMESWSHDWLWKEFDIEPDSEEAFVFRKENLLPKRGAEKSKYLPRRMITVDHHKLKTLFRGEKEDYERLDQSIFSQASGSVPSGMSAEVEYSETQSESEDILKIRKKQKRVGIGFEASETSEFSAAREEIEGELFGFEEYLENEALPVRSRKSIVEEEESPMKSARSIIDAQAKSGKSLLESQSPVKSGMSVSGEKKSPSKSGKPILDSQAQSTIKSGKSILDAQSPEKSEIVDEKSGKSIIDSEALTPGKSRNSINESKAQSLFYKEALDEMEGEELELIEGEEYVGEEYVGEENVQYYTSALEQNVEYEDLA